MTSIWVVTGFTWIFQAGILVECTVPSPGNLPNPGIKLLAYLLYPTTLADGFFIFSDHGSHLSLRLPASDPLWLCF